MAISKPQSRQRNEGHVLRWLAVPALLLAATLFAGCGPSAQPTLTAQVYGPAKPDDMPTLAPTSTDVPAAPPTPTVLVPTLRPTDSAPEPTEPIVVERKPVKVTILHTNDVMGEIEPCGWGTPKGGMARRATFIKDEPRSDDSVLLILDAGNTLLGDWYSVKSEGQVIVESMNMLGYDAMAVGRMDLAKGIDLTYSCAETAQFPFLSANMVDADTLEPLFEPYTIIERSGARIAIIGLSEEEAIPATGEHNVKILSPTKTAKELVAELRPQVDLVIVLSHVGYEYDLSLAEAVPGIDVIIGGNSRKLMDAPERVGNTLVVQQGYNGEWIGRLTAEFDADGVPVTYHEDIVALTPEWDDDPEMAALVTEFMEMYPMPTAVPTPTLDPSQPTPTIAVIDSK